MHRLDDIGFLGIVVEGAAQLGYGVGKDIVAHMGIRPNRFVYPVPGEHFARVLGKEGEHLHYLGFDLDRPIPSRQQVQVALDQPVADAEFTIHKPPPALFRRFRIRFR
jgi:hypothetical protein